MEDGKALGLKRIAAIQRSTIYHLPSSIPRLPPYFGGSRGDVIHCIRDADDDVAARFTRGQADLEFLAPRVGDSILRVNDPPAAGVERVLHLLNCRLIVANRKGQRPRARLSDRLDLDPWRRVVDVEAGALEFP